MTNYSRSVLKSNGLRHLKNLPVKFGFSLKTVPANIAQKLPPQVPSQTIFHHDFQLLAQTAHVRSHSRKRVHTRLSEKDGTQRLTRRNRGVSDGGWYHYPRTVSHVSEILRGQGVERQTVPLLGLGRGHSRRTQRACGTAMRMMRVAVTRRRGPAGLRRPTPPAERTVLAPISPRVQLCLRRPAFPLSAFIPGA